MAGSGQYVRPFGKPEIALLGFGVAAFLAIAIVSLGQETSKTQRQETFKVCSIHNSSAVVWVKGLPEAYVYTDPYDDETMFRPYDAPDGKYPEFSVKISSIKPNATICQQLDGTVAN